MSALAIPNREYLQAVADGEIIVKMERGPHGHIFVAPRGLFLLRKHHEAGYLWTYAFAPMAGYPEGLFEHGQAARLTEKGKAFLALPPPIS